VAVTEKRLVWEIESVIDTEEGVARYDLVPVLVSDAVKVKVPVRDQLTVALRCSGVTASEFVVDLVADSDRDILSVGEVVRDRTMFLSLLTVPLVTVLEIDFVPEEDGLADFDFDSECMPEAVPVSERYAEKVSPLPVRDTVCVSSRVYVSDDVFVTVNRDGVSSL
jgi:hypothetical protein